MDKYKTIVKTMTDIFHNDAILKNSLFVLFFIPEVLVIYQLFTSLPHGVGGWLFWCIVATVIMIYHLYVIIKIKGLINPFNPAVIGYGFTYAGLLTILWIAVLSFNLKSIEKKSGIENLESMKNADIVDTIQGNKMAIDKYNNIINITNDVKVIFKYRNMVTALTASNDNLYNRVESTTNITESDAFQVLADKTTHNREMVIFSFLCLIWLICESGLFVVAPAGKVKSNINIIIEKGGLDYIKNRMKLFETWLKHLVIDNDLNNLNNDNSMGKFGVSYSVSKKFREALADIYSVENEEKISLLNNTETGSSLNFKPEIILNALKNK